MDVTNPVSIIRVTEGDIYECQIELGYNISIRTFVRLDGYDTPERRGVSDAEKQMAEEATQFAKRWCELQWGLWARWQGAFDAYGRPLVQIISHGESLGKVLEMKGLAVPDNGESRDGRRRRMEALVASRSTSDNIRIDRSPRPLPAKMNLTNQVRIIRIINGNTYECEIDLGYNVITKTTVRLMGYDTPERHGVSDEEKAMAEDSFQFIAAWCKAQWHLVAEWSEEWDAYGRPLVEILGYGETLGDELVKAGLAVRDTGGSRDDRRAKMEELVASRTIG